MALIACSECGKEVSDKASACPNCGNPLTAPVKVQVVPPKSKNVGCFTTIVVIFLALVLVSMCSDNNSARPRPAASAPSTAPAEPATAAAALASLKKRWDPAGAPSSTHVAMLEDARNIARRFPDSPEAAEAAELVPALESKVKAFRDLAAVAVRAEKWRYRHDTDSMTDERTAFASLTSENTISLDFPYQGAQHATLMLRQHPQHGFDAIVQIERGQVLCQSYEDCTVQVRFDDGEVRGWRGVGAADHSTETVFFRNPRDFYAQFKKAKVVRISFDIYQAGSPTFVFDVGGFDEAKFKGG